MSTFEVINIHNNKQPGFSSGDRDAAQAELEQKQTRTGGCPSRTRWSSPMQSLAHGGDRGHDQQDMRDLLFSMCLCTGSLHRVKCCFFCGTLHWQFAWANCHFCCGHPAVPRALGITFFFCIGALFCSCQKNTFDNHAVIWMSCVVVGAPLDLHEKLGCIRIHGINWYPWTPWVPMGLYGTQNA